MAEAAGATSAQRITRAAFKAWLDGKSPSIKSSSRAASLPVGKPETDSEDESYSGVSWSAGPADENPLGLPSKPHRTPAPASIPKGQQGQRARRGSLGQHSKHHDGWMARAHPSRLPIGLLAFVQEDKSNSIVLNGLAGAQAASQSKLAAAVTHSTMPSLATPDGKHAAGEGNTGLVPAISARGVSISVAEQQPLSKATQSLVPAKEPADRSLRGHSVGSTDEVHLHLSSFA